MKGKVVIKVSNDLEKSTDPALKNVVDDMFDYHTWDDDKIQKGHHVREALKNACMVILSLVPPCEDRNTAIRKLREVRMDCNSAITHDGKY